MSRSSLAVAWYCFRVSLRARRRAYAVIALLLGLVGGLALASLAGARRTQSSYSTLLAGANSAQVVALTGLVNPLLGSTLGYNPALIKRISRLPNVTAVGSQVGLNILPISASDTPLKVKTFTVSAGNGLGSVGGEGFTLDRLSVVAGRLADPGRTDQIDVSDQVAPVVGWHVGQRIRIGVYTNDQTNLADFGTNKVKPVRVEEVTLVGLVEEPHQVIQDDVDDSQSLAFFTPAFTRGLLSCCTNYAESSIQVSPGPGHAEAVVPEVAAMIPTAPYPATLSSVTSKAERALRPESIALAVFGAIAGLAALLIGLQLIGRELRARRVEVEVLRAVGAGPVSAIGPGLIGAALSSLAGAVMAVLVAVGLSPFAPLGPVRPVYPQPGLSWDWTVLGAGLLILTLVPVAAAILISVRSAPHRSGRRPPSVGAGATVARAAAAGLPAPAVTGIHFALEPGGSDAVPIRSAILGAALAVIVLISTVIFGTSLDSLVSKPPLYGWNWDYALVAGGASGNMAQAPATRLLNSDRYVTAWSAAYFSTVSIDGQVVPVLTETPGASVQPPILSGHDLHGADEIVLGAVTLAALHKQIGDTVQVSQGVVRPVRLRIVGEASLPTMGSGQIIHLEMGTGALIATDLLPAGAKDPFDDPLPGPEVAFLRIKGGVPPSAAHQSSIGIPVTTGDAAVKSLVKIGDQLTNNFNFGVDVSNVLRPAEIVNYRSLGTTPAVLGGALTLGAVSALALTLVASVRRRRRELALLKTLGFTGRQLASAVAWQSSVAVGIGTVVGVPLGIIAGRTLWNLFAEDIHAVPQPSVPGWYLAAIAVGAMVLANLVAALPGRMAARTPTGLLLRLE